MAVAQIVTQSPSPAMVWLRLGILLTKTAGAYLVGALMGLNWSEMSGQQQFLIVVAGIVALATAIESFYDKTAARAEQGAAMIASGNTASPFPAASASPTPIP